MSTVLASVPPVLQMSDAVQKFAALEKQAVMLRAFSLDETVLLEAVAAAKYMESKVLMATKLADDVRRSIDLPSSGLSVVHEAGKYSTDTVTVTFNWRIFGSHFNERSSNPVWAIEVKEQFNAGLRRMLQITAAGEHPLQQNRGNA